MQQIITPHDTVLRILGNQQSSGSGWRLMNYCVCTPVPEGVLLHNLLTREMVLLTQAEFQQACQQDYLRKHWFVVPQETQDHELVQMVRWVRLSARRDNGFNGYTILTTTHCNARCFYCYEKGCTPVSMTKETALKTAEYIKNHCGGKGVSLTWFGGEPLVNAPVIDLICEKLRADGVELTSRMISNGYLFDQATVAKAKELWNLKFVQITLDGTEDVYNRAKAYVYKAGSAYQVVLNNIGRLLDAGIPVVVRMNMEMGNALDLQALADELAARFQGKSGLRAYAHLLFSEGTPWYEQHTDAEWNWLHDQLFALEDKLIASGLANGKVIQLSRKLKLNHCMADCGRSLVVVPDGHLGLCEHFSESEFCGHIDSPDLDPGMMASWQEMAEELPECAGCFHYPQCVILKKCPDTPDCHPHRRDFLLRSHRRAMIQEYLRWQKGTQAEIEEELPE